MVQSRFVSHDLHERKSLAREVGMRMNRVLIAAIVTSAFGVGVAVADTTDQNWMNKVELQKTGAHCIDDKNCFNRYHPAIPGWELLHVHPDQRFYVLTIVHTYGKRE